MMRERIPCAECAMVETFQPRLDERLRFGFGDVGYGCKRPGFEGYTTADATCEAARRRAP
jgi:hypothetical protein